MFDSVAFIFTLVIYGVSAIGEYPPGVPPKTYQHQGGYAQNQPQHGQEFYGAQAARQHQPNPKIMAPLFDEKYKQTEKEHIASHLNAEYDHNKMNDEQFNFLQFKTMDTDNSDFIDGLEVYKFLYHALKENVTGVRYEDLASSIEAQTDEFMHACSNPNQFNGFIHYDNFKRCIQRTN